MQETEKERASMKLRKTKTFDESKLTEPQRAALMIAKTQGAPFSRSLENLMVELEQKDTEELFNTIVENRKRDSLLPNKNPLR